MTHPKRITNIAVEKPEASRRRMEESDLTERLSADPNFKALVRQRFKLRLILSVTVILLYFSFILLVAFWPASMAYRVIPGSVVSGG